MLTVDFSKFGVKLCKLKENSMTHLSKVLIFLAIAITISGCSNMVTVAERDSYAEPKWYAECAESGFEGLFWWREEYVYACGGGQSRFFQAAEEQMYAIAMNHFAKRLNGVVDSSTVLEFENDSKNTATVISYAVENTVIREHITQERAKFRHAGEFYTFVRLKMERSIFENLMQEAQNERLRSPNN